MNKKYHYTYRINFPYQKWFYYGVHSTNDLDDNYAGSPCTHKEKWELFEWEKTILEFFETRSEAEEVEIRLITATWKDKYSLNEHNRRGLSIDAGLRGIKTQVEREIGIFRPDNHLKLRESGKGCYDPEVRRLGQIAGLQTVIERKIGYMDPEVRRKGGETRAKELSKPIILRNKKTGEIRKFGSYTNAAKELNTYCSSISLLVARKIHHTRGWELAPENDKIHLSAE